jgi:RNA polymerase sigma-70 factor, ECF subfamily
MQPPEDVTALLADISTGDQGSWNRLLAVVYRELHAMAHKAMRGERPGHTLQTTALVNEAYMRLVRNRKEGWKNRVHFFSVAARAMRRILVDKARAHRTAKRGHGRQRIPLTRADGADAKPGVATDPFEDIEALDKALDAFEKDHEHERKCTVVELRFFVGLTLEQTAEILDLSLATVKRDWEFARAWLRRHMSSQSRPRK